MKIKQYTSEELLDRVNRLELIIAKIHGICARELGLKSVFPKKKKKKGKK